MQQLLLQLAPPPAPSLDNFIPGRNGAALQALRDIAEGKGGERFVYLWGEPASGRTHLLRGLVRAAGGAAQDKVIAVDDVQDLAADEQIRLFDRYNRVRAAGGALVA
ncbi:MAG: DnaA regulatory inactivator Hda, partial [Burkholderiales bacterium]|nr:DnaA regulatory inactivator Hda [Burkholderiales bacterium]